MLLVAVSAWSEELASCGELRLIGDAKGVLQSVMSGRSKHPRLNLIIAELQLALGARSQIELSVVHWWSEDNTVCDKRSRIDEGESIPSTLSSARFRAPASRSRWKLVGS